MKDNITNYRSIVGGGTRNHLVDITFHNFKAYEQLPLELYLSAILV